IKVFRHRSLGSAAMRPPRDPRTIVSPALPFRPVTGHRTPCRRGTQSPALVRRAATPALVPHVRLWDNPLIETSPIRPARGEPISKLLSCVRGHFWESDAEPTPDKPITCPECGATSDVVPLLDLAPSHITPDLRPPIRPPTTPL